MRKSRKQTAESRERILKAASEEFRGNGLEGTVLAEVMSAAGMTHGGFYKHFTSKEQLVVESLAFGMEAMLESWRLRSASERPGQGLQSSISRYLSAAHRESISRGCPFAALAPDIARSGEAVRAATTDGFLKMVDLIADQLPHTSRSAARKKALWIFTSMIGAIVMSRVVDDPTMSDAILKEARKHLLSAAI